MTQDLIYRVADPAEFAAVAALRWQLKFGDEAKADDPEFAAFVERFVKFETHERRSGEAYHWIALDGADVIAVMTVITVRKVPSPDGESGHWLYLTNCIVKAAHRDQGIGEQLSARIKAWAGCKGAEMMLVWPSERAFSFYERCGFAPPEGVLSWEP